MLCWVALGLNWDGALAVCWMVRRGFELQIIDSGLLHARRKEQHNPTLRS
jgi:hypothetical protein